MRKIKFLVFSLTCFIGTVAGQGNNAAFKVPAYEKTVLKNGLTVYLMEQKEVPMITVSVVIPAGAIYDKPQQAGLAMMTASSIMNGTTKMSKNKLEEELDFIGATVSTFASKESAGLNAKFASKDRDKVLSIVRDVLLSPSFDEKEFEKEKSLTLAQLEQARESPRNVIGEYFDQVSYGSHVYANPENGRISTVGKLTVGDARAFFKKAYIPNGSAIAVVGDFDTKELKAKLTALFSGWEKGVASANAASATVAPNKAASVLLVNKSDAKETTFIIGGPGVARSNPDYVAMEVVNTVFGGRFTSWLNDELRVNTGLTYGARSSFNRLKNAGNFGISTFTATKNTEAAMDKALEVLKKLHTTGIDEKNLTSAKNYVKGGFPPRYETAGQLANLLTSMFWYGYDESFINNFQKNVDELTVDRAKAIVAKYFPKDNLQFIMIGKAEDIRKVAGKYGKVTEVQIKDEGTGKTF
ncbi:MAG TPA: pitrilysin family protein [Flavisolibacter sp.]|jgi:predicted Zn-dependent peptidase|nr:pitrilysin family protein [Flavisolibacter sp.]